LSLGPLVGLMFFIGQFAVVTAFHSVELYLRLAAFFFCQLCENTPPCATLLSSSVLQNATERLLVRFEI